MSVYLHDLTFSLADNLTTIDCTIIPAFFPTFQELLADPKMPVVQTYKKFPATLVFEKNKLTYGACKYAYFGEASVPIFEGSSSKKICVKEAFYIARETGHRMIYDGPQQGKLLTSEINCARWANALMCMVNEFISFENMKIGAPPFSVPDMRYVRVALAISTQND